MDFSGSDLLDYIKEILQDLQNLGSIDLVGFGFRVLFLFFGAVLFVVLSKFLMRIFWDVFGGMIRFIWRLFSAPYVVPRDKLRRYRNNRRWEREKKERRSKQN